jgi:hypothetical protein
MYSLRFYADVWSKKSIDCIYVKSDIFKGSYGERYTEWRDVKEKLLGRVQLK